MTHHSGFLRQDISLTLCFGQRVVRRSPRANTNGSLPERRGEPIARFRSTEHLAWASPHGNKELASGILRRKVARIASGRASQVNALHLLRWENERPCRAL